VELTIHDAAEALAQVEQTADDAMRYFDEAAGLRAENAQLRAENRALRDAGCPVLEEYERCDTRGVPSRLATLIRAMDRVFIGPAAELLSEATTLGAIEVVHG